MELFCIRNIGKVEYFLTWRHVRSIITLVVKANNATTNDFVHGSNFFSQAVLNMCAGRGNSPALK